MNTKNTGALKRAAGLRLSEAACTPKRLILIHTGAAVLASLVSTVLCYLLDLQIGKTGGLGGMGARANLQTLRSLLSMLPGFAALYWEMGYFAAMLRIARGERAAPDSLLEGFCRFWPVTRYTLLKTFLLVSLTMTSLYAAVLIAAPLMEPVAESLMSALEAGAADVTQLDPTVQEALLRSSIPMLVVFGVLVLTAVVLAFYPLRLASYALLDEPRGSALAAMRTSVRLLRGHKLELLRLDLSFWWYYLLQGGLAVVCYLDVLLAALRVEVALSPVVMLFGTYGLYLAGELALYCGFRNRVEGTYVQFYEALRTGEGERVQTPAEKSHPWDD